MRDASDRTTITFGVEGKDRGWADSYRGIVDLEVQGRRSCSSPMRRRRSSFSFASCPSNKSRSITLPFETHSDLRETMWGLKVQRSNSISSVVLREGEWCCEQEERWAVVAPLLLLPPW